MNFADSFFQPVYSNFESCGVTSFLLLIWVDCFYYRTSAAIGFQTLAQQKDVDEVHKLYINQTRDRQTTVGVQVEMKGTYLITVFAMMEGMGIIGSHVEFYTQIKVNDLPGILLLPPALVLLTP